VSECNEMLMEQGKARGCWLGFDVGFGKFIRVWTHPYMSEVLM